MGFHSDSISPVFTSRVLMEPVELPTETQLSVTAMDLITPARTHAHMHKHVTINQQIQSSQPLKNPMLKRTFKTEEHNSNQQI